MYTKNPNKLFYYLPYTIHRRNRKDGLQRVIISHWHLGAVLSESGLGADCPYDFVFLLATFFQESELLSLQFENPVSQIKISLESLHEMLFPHPGNSPL